MADVSNQARPPHRSRRPTPSGSIGSDLNAIALRCANRPITLSSNDILGYDDRGAPTR